MDIRCHKCSYCNARQEPNWHSLFLRIRARKHWPGKYEICYLPYLFDTSFAKRLHERCRNPILDLKLPTKPTFRPYTVTPQCKQLNLSLPSTHYSRFVLGCGICQCLVHFCLLLLFAGCVSCGIGIHTHLVGDICYRYETFLHYWNYWSCHIAGARMLTFTCSSYPSRYTFFLLGEQWQFRTMPLA